MHYRNPIRYSLVPLAAALAVACLAIAPLQVSASDLLLDNPGSNSACVNAVEMAAQSTEAATAFDLTADIERLVARGHFLDAEAVWVRFFEDSGDGPGALQARFFLPAGVQGLTLGARDNDRIDITLPQPFQATGRHYVSIEPVASGPSQWWLVDTGSPVGANGNARTEEGVWMTLDATLCFSLHGTLAADAVIDSLGETSLSRSGFLEVFGTSFGTSGELFVDGQSAVIATWTDNRIAAYVPEGAGPGTVPVQVVSDGGASNSVFLDVSLREPDGRFLWRVRQDSFYSQVRPAVGPDSTIYAVDVHDRLYAIAPDGAVLWVVTDAGSKGVDVGADGTIYTGNEDWIKAFHPDGSEKWTFTQNPRAFILIDVAVGPDGNVYGVGSSGMGVFSLTPQGSLRWTSPEAYDRPIVVYTEIVFGPGPDGQEQLYFIATRELSV